MTGIPETCAPVTFSPTGPQLLCDTKDQHPQTYQGNQGDTTYYKKHVRQEDQRRVRRCPTTPPDANRGDSVQEVIAVQNGIKADQSPTASGRDPQSVYTPIVQKMKADSSNYGWSGLAYANVVQLHQEAQLQGLNDPKHHLGLHDRVLRPRSSSRRRATG